MAASYVADYSTSGSAASSLTLSFTAGAGSNRKLIVFASREATTPFSSLTYAGSSTGVTLIGSQATNGNDKMRAYYIDEATLLGGSQDIVLTLSGSTASIRLAAILLQDAPSGAVHANNPATPSATTAIESSLVTSVDNCFVCVAAMCSSGSRSTSHGGQTNQVAISGSSPRFYADTEPQATAATEAFGYTWSASATGIVIAVAVAPISSSAAMMLRRRRD